MAYKIKIIAPSRCAMHAAHRLKTFALNTTGAAAVEFAIAFWAFLFFFAFLLEFALIIWGNTTIDNMVTQAARKGMVGCIVNSASGGECADGFAVNPTELRRGIRDASAGMIDACSEKFTFNVAPVAPGDTPEEFNPGSINLGTSQQIVAYKAGYEWQVFFPLLKVERLFGQFVNYEVAILVRNEPFGANSGIREGGAAGGC